MTKISVDKIEIRIGKKTLSLTPGELKELRDVLDATFPTGITAYIPSAPIIIERPVYPSWPYRRWNEPTYIECGETTAKGGTLYISSSTDVSL